MKRNRLIGLVLLILAMVLIGFGLREFLARPSQTSINGYIGGEKIGIVENPKFIKYVNDKYGLEMDYRKVGSFEMVSADSSSMDYLWPSSQLAEELYDSQAKAKEGSEIIFNTPIVLYSWQAVVDGLIDSGLARKDGDVYYVDMEGLAEEIYKQTPWEDLGVNLYGSITVQTTDPNKSNSGNMFLGLLANALNSSRPVSQEDLGEIKPKIEKIYDNLGYLQSSSSDIFSQYIRQGMGSYPLIAGYENQILEFSLQEADVFNNPNNDMVILYPEPTVWSSHVYISLTEEGNIGMEVFRDPYIEKLVWEQHGFRTTESSVNNPFNVDGVAPRIKSVMNMPNVEVHLELMDAAD